MKTDRVAIFVFAVVSAATLLPLWSGPGWPSNHNGPIFAWHTYIYARHYSWLDILPIWSSADAFGFGSPMPATYHKLFYMPAGILALATGSLKFADAAAIFLFLIAGALGMYLTMLELGASRVAAIVAGLCLITANYTVTDWLVRGAVTEFAAAMVMPWAFLQFAKSLRAGRLTIGLGVALAVLWIAHSVLGYYTSLLLGATYLLLPFLGLASWSLLRPQTAWRASLAFAAIVAPFLLPMAVLSRAYDVRRILTAPYQPAYQFRRPIEYVWETYFRWGPTAAGLVVEIDHAILVTLIVGLGALALRRRQADGATPRDVVRPIAAFLIIAALGLFLQLEIAEPFYEWIPGAVYIQFPWRLLAMITPALIVAALFVADKALPPRMGTLALGLVAAWMVVACGAFVPLEDPRIAIEPNFANLNIAGYHENEPRDAAPPDEIRAALHARWKEAGCTLENLNPDNDEVPVARFHTSCAKTTTLPLPLYSSSLHRVTTRDAERQPCVAIDGFPHVCGVVVPAGEDVIAVRLPRFSALFKTVR